MKHFIEEHMDRFLYMAIFSIAFAVLGYNIPKIYREFIDNTQYIEITQPVSTEFLEYKRGDNAGLLINRKSLITVSVRQTARIVHVNGNTVSTQLGVGDTPLDIVILKSKDFVTTKTNSLYIPCNAIPGRNYFEIIFTYRYNGVDKSYSYISQVFTVLDEKADRCK